MAQTVKLKRTSVANRHPTTSHIEVGELAFNSNDKSLFIRGDSNAIVTLHDEDTLHIDHSNNRVGIGTTSPDANLHISSAGGTELHLQEETAGQAAQIKLTNTQNSFIVGSDANPQIFFINTDGNQGSGLCMDTSHNVGIGTDSPARELHIQNNGAVWLQMTTENTTTGTVGLLFGDTNATTKTRIVNDASDNLQFWTSTSESARLDSSGNLGINETTPLAKLEVAGSIKATSKDTGHSSEAGVTLSYDTSNSIGLLETWTSKPLLTRTYNYQAFDISGTEMMRINSTGIGIGTNSPGHKLHVVGANNTTPFSIDVGAAASYNFKANSNSTYSTTFNMDADGLTIGHDSAYREVALQTAGTNRLVIAAAGAITFNSAYTFPTADGSANQVLATDGSGALSFVDAASGGGGVSISNNVNNRVLTGDGTNANAEANLTFDGTNLTTTGAYIADTHFRSSDGNVTLSATGGGGVYLRPDGNGSSANQVFVASGTGDVTTSGKLYLSGQSNNYLQHDSDSLRAVTSHGYIQIGPANTGHAHFLTDRSNFYFNTRIEVNSGIIASYDEDLILRRARDTSYELTLKTTGLELDQGKMHLKTGLYSANNEDVKLRQYHLSTGDAGGSFLLGKIENSANADGGVEGIVRFAHDYGSSTNNCAIHFHFAQRSGTARGAWWYEHDDQEGSADRVHVRLIDDGAGNMYVWATCTDYAKSYIETTWRQSTSASDSGTLTAGTLTTGTTLFDTANDPTSEMHIGRLYTHNDIYLPDGKKVNYGSSNDLQIYHDVTNSLIRNYTGNLIIQNDKDDGDIIIRSDDGSGGVTPYLTFDGANTRNRFHKNVLYGDGIRADFGDSSDLRIYHDGSNSYIHDNGTGNLKVRTNSFNLMNAANSEVMINANENGAVTLYYDNSAKLATKSDGVDITGELQADSLDVDGNADISGFLTINSSTDGKLKLKTPSGETTDWNYIEFFGVDNVRDGYVGTDGDGDMKFFSDKNSSELRLESSGATISTNLTVSGTLEATSFSDGTISGITFIDEDSFSTNSATRVPTQQSIKAYVDAQVAGVVDTAPAALNTLNELAAALGDDASFSTTTSTALGNRLRVDTASQGLTGTQQANAITNLGITATKAELNYVDGVTSNIQTQLDGKQASGSYLTGNQTITLSGDVSGSGTTSIAVTVADDSHNHIISNVDGLQTALDGKVGTTGNETITGNKTFTGTTTAYNLYIDNNTTNYIRMYTENNTTNIADTFTDTTTDKSYIYFGAGDSSNDPGFIMHETSEASSPDERNEGVLHLVPSDDNATNDYVSIHGTNDPDCIRLHTSGLIETAGGHTLTISSDSGTINLNDNTSVSGNITVTGTVDGRDIATDGTKLDTIDTNADVTPSWVPSSNPNYLTGNQTITLSGDVSGSGTTSIAVTVADDSHNHIISNVDGLQTALDAKLPLAGGTMTGDINLNDNDLKNINLLQFKNRELTDFDGSMQMILDANDGDSNVPAHGDFAGSLPFGIYFTGDNDSSTTTLGSGLSKVWHTGHFNKAHIDYFVGLYNTGVTTTEYDYLDGVTSNIQTQLNGKLTSSSTSVTNKLPLAGGTMTGSIAMANFNITGVNQLEINDPGEGIIFKSGASGDMQLRILDDSSDNILQYSGTNALFDVAGTIRGDALRIDKAPESLGNQPSIAATFDSTGTDGLALISVEHLTNSTASALGAGIRFKTGDGSTGSANKESYIFMQGGGNHALKYIADKNHQFYVDHHDNSIEGTGYNDYGTLALEIAESGEVEAKYDLDVHGNYKMDNTTIIDTSKNLVNIATISAGVFTTNANTGTFSNSIGALPLVTSTPYDYVAKFESTDAGAAIIIEDNSSTNNANRIAVSGNTMQLVTAATTALTLDASQNATFYGDLTIPSKIRHSGDTDNYFSFSATDTQSFVTGNSTRLQITNSLVRLNQENNNQDFAVYSSNEDHCLYVDASTDRVGIGTATPGKKLEVAGVGNTDGIRITGGSANVSQIINNTGTGGVAWDISSSGAGHGHGNGKLLFNVGFSSIPWLALAPDRKVGIGTHSPTSRLEVHGTVGVLPDTTNASLQLRDTTALAINNGGSIIFSGIYDSSGNHLGSGPFIKAYKLNATSGDYSYGLKFGTRENGVGNNIVGLTIAPDQNVGIGTSTPTHKLEVSGSFAATTKSFDIEHPSKKGMRLHHGVVEGPEHSVYVRGKSKEKVILLPDYWVDLIHEDTITVQLTAIGSGQDLYVEDIKDNKVFVNGDNYFYYIQAERKDVERFEVEYNAN